MEQFVGIRTHKGLKVFFVDNRGTRRPLPPRLKWMNHSPTGFEAGYSGSGPAQLALAIAGELMPKEEALRIYQRLKFRIVAALPQNESWTLNKSDVQKVIDMIKQDVDFRISKFDDKGNIHTVTI